MPHSKNFDPRLTIKEASDHGFNGVQLSIFNPDYHQPGYTSSLISSLTSHRLSLIIHLPNLPVKADIKVAEELINKSPNSLVLIHFRPLTQLPQVRGTIVGWENSVNGPNIEHVVEVQRHVEEDNTFFVFDYGRLMNTEQEEVKQRIRAFLDHTLSQLRPDKDVIHLTDKTDWEKRFRDCPCAFGRGVFSEFLPRMKSFVTQGGRVVFEHEDLQMAIDSLKVF